MVEKYDKRNKKYRQKRALLKSARSKMSVTFVIFMVILIALSVRILFIQYVDGDKYTKTVLDQQSSVSTVLPYKRGQILDSNGTVLAYSEKVYNLILDPKVLLQNQKCVDSTLDALVQYFNLDRANLENILATKSNSQYQKLLKELTEDQISEFQTAKSERSDIKGVWFEEGYLRKYPYGTLACDVIGFASVANGGEIGLEKQYNDELSGVDGAVYNFVNEYIESESAQKEAVDGNNIVTTIDYRIQSVMEKKVAEMMELRPATSACAIMMNPNNGEILGMVNWPYFDLNNPRDISGIYSEEELNAMTDEEKLEALYSVWSNYCVSNIYEPGSTFKTLTVAMALEENAIKDGDTFYCGGSVSMAGYTLRCHGTHKTVDVTKSLAYSCNPALVQIGAKVGAKMFSKYESLFGLGSKTGIDLPGEEKGLIQPETMQEIDLACASFGQNINLTMVQMCAAYSSVLNGGNYYQPHIVKRIETSEGEVVKNIEPTLVRQTVTEETSELIKRYLKSVVEDGTGANTYLEGYSIGGKSGSAQKHPRSEKRWIMSFIGAAPIENPNYLLYVIVDEPYGTTGNPGMSDDAKDIYREIFRDLIPYLGIYKDTQDEAPVVDESVKTESGVEVPEGNASTEGESETEALETQPAA